MAVIMLETGMRPEEVCRMERRHLHLNEGYYFNPYGADFAESFVRRLVHNGDELVTR